jgi:hypothetical protein
MNGQPVKAINERRWFVLLTAAPNRRIKAEKIID